MCLWTMICTTIWKWEIPEARTQSLKCYNLEVRNVGLFVGRQIFTTIWNKTGNVHKNTEARSDLCTLGSSQVIQFSPLGIHFVIVVVVAFVYKCYYRYYSLLHFFQKVEYVNIFLIYPSYITSKFQPDEMSCIFCITDIFRT